MKVGNDIYYVGVNDHQVDLFEGQYDVPNGMSYNSYVIMDEKIAVMGITVDDAFCRRVAWQCGKCAEWCEAGLSGSYSIWNRIMQPISRILSKPIRR